MEFDPDLPWRTIHGHGFNGLVGPITFATVGENEWRFYLDVGSHHINMGGVCHGGVSMTLADVGMGAAAYQIGGNNPCTTVQFETQFIAAAKQGDRLIGRSRCVRRTRDLAFMEAELWANGRQTLNASGIWKYLAKKG